jgi:hypothetical protein
MMKFILNYLNYLAIYLNYFGNLFIILMVKKIKSAGQTKAKIGNRKKQRDLDKAAITGDEDGDVNTDAHNEADFYLDEGNLY